MGSFRNGTQQDLNGQVWGAKRSPKLWKWGTKPRRIPTDSRGESAPQLNSTATLQWRHNEGDGVSNHRRLDCLPHHLFRRRSKKTWKLRDTGLCKGNPPVIGGFPSQRARYAENVSTWWRHHENHLHVLWMHVLCIFCILYIQASYYRPSAVWMGHLADRWTPELQGPLLLTWI